MVFFIGTRLNGKLNFSKKTDSKDGEKDLKKYVTFRDVMKYLNKEQVKNSKYTPHNKKRVN